MLENKLVYAYGSALRSKISVVNGTVHRLSDKAIYALVDRYDAYTCLRYRRLAFLARLLGNGSPALISLLDGSVDLDGSFAYLVIRDMPWLRKFASLTDSLPNPQDHLAPWLSLAASSAWRTTLLKARRNATFFRVCSAVPF